MSSELIENKCVPEMNTVKPELSPNNKRILARVYELILSWPAPKKDELENCRLFAGEGNPDKDVDTKLTGQVQKDSIRVDQNQEKELQNKHVTF